MPWARGLRPWLCRALWGFQAVRKRASQGAAPFCHSLWIWRCLCLIFQGLSCNLHAAKYQCLALGLRPLCTGNAKVGHRYCTPSTATNTAARSASRRELWPSAIENFQTSMKELARLCGAPPADALRWMPGIYDYTSGRLKWLACFPASAFQYLACEDKADRPGEFFSNLLHDVIWDCCRAWMLPPISEVFFSWSTSLLFS